VCILRSSAVYLVGDIGAGLADVAAHLAHDADVVVAVEQVELVLAAGAAAADAVRGLVRLEGGAAQHDDHALRVFVAARDGLVLLGDELGQVGRGQRLRPWVGRHVSRLNAGQVECRRRGGVWCGAAVVEGWCAGCRGP
jgi:hypothetical protein